MKDIRIGKVSCVHYDTGAIDVLFEDEEDLVRQNIPLVSNEYKMPEVGDMVTVIFQSNSDSSEQGFAIGQPYSSANKPEKYGRGMYFKRFSKTAFICYDPKSDTLEIHANNVRIVNFRNGD